MASTGGHRNKPGSGRGREEMWEVGEGEKDRSGARQRDRERPHLIEEKGTHYVRGRV
jgi:hypothetical protein